MNIVAFIISGVMLGSSSIQLFTAKRLFPEKKTPTGRLVFWPQLYCGLFNAALGLIVLFGAITNGLKLVLPLWIEIIVFTLFLLYYLSEARLALTLAGIVREKSNDR